MRIAFYAPMKPPDDPLPSGDRQMARLLVAALGHAGHRVELASHLVTWRPLPDADEDARLAVAAEAEIDRILGRAAAGERPELWFTYHLYHKAPDLLGPRVAAALGIPYVVVEASRAGKRARDAWAPRLAIVDAALAAADAVVAVHAEDAEGLAAIVGPDRLHLMPPFLDAAPFAAAGRGRVAETVSPRLLAVAMMRPGDKARSYTLLADALGRLTGRLWTLDIVGDGRARPEVAAAFAEAGLAGRVSLRGAVRPTALPAIYAGADLFVWPAINEAYGMVFLEAQAAGVPVVGARRSGVAAIVRDGKTGLLVPEGDAEAFAAAVAALLDDPARRAAMGKAAAAHVARNHDMPAGARRLDAILAKAAARRAAVA